MEKKAALDWLAGRVARTELTDAEKGVAVFELFGKRDVLPQPLGDSGEVEYYGRTEERLIQKLKQAFPDETVTRPDGKLSLCDSRRDLGRVYFNVRLPASVITALSEGKESLLLKAAASRARGGRAGAATPAAGD